MKKLLVVGIVVLFIGMTISATTGFNDVEQSNIPTFNGKTLYVGGSGPGNYSKIQEAIDDANDGDTVFVYDDSSPYDEALLIEKSINLIGENKETTIIEILVLIIIEVNANELSIKHFTIRGGEIGIYGSLNNGIISDNFFTCYSACIVLEDSSNNMILNNRIENTPEYWDYGIGLFRTSENIVSGNVIQTCGKGIWMAGCLNNKINENIIRNNFLYGISIGRSFSNIFTKNNFLNNNQNALDESNNTWHDGGYGNYWDDYEDRYPNAKPKLLRPWIWNTPYEIPGGSNKDKNPLVKEWPNSLSKIMPKNKAGNMHFNLLLRILERFPLLQQMLDML